MDTLSELDYFRQLNQTPEQQKFLEAISASRGYSSNEILNSYRALFIPDGNTMMDMLGKTSISKMLFTSDGRSFVPGKLLIPGFTPLGYLTTFVSYDAIARMEARETNIYDRPYYFYPEESTGFKKTNFLLMPYESWQPALESRKISLADGVFDGGAVSACGIPCASMLGSTIGAGVKRILSVFDTVSLYKDNDEAGASLFRALSRSLKNVELIKIPHLAEKDIDGFIEKVGKEAFLSAITVNGKVDLINKRFDRFS